MVPISWPLDVIVVLGLVSAILIWCLENDIINGALVSHLEGGGSVHGVANLNGHATHYEAEVPEGGEVGTW